MIEIRTLLPGEGDAARRVIYTVAGMIFKPELPPEKHWETLRVEWPLPDIDEQPNRYVPPDGLFLVAVDADQVVGTGAVRRLDATTAELKRLWLLPEYQGRKIGYALMQELMGFARRRGYQRMVLTTSVVYQQRALAFYQKLGFEPIPMFHEDVDEDEGAFGLDL